MIRKVQETFRQSLVERRKALLDGVAGAEADLLAIAAEREAEVGEQAQEERLARELTLLDARGRDEIAEIDAALERIDDGDYGMCEDCENDIPVLRLRALPFARLCLDCAAAREGGSAAAD